MGEGREVNFYITTQPRRYVKKVYQPSKLGALSKLRQMQFKTHDGDQPSKLETRVPRFQELEIKRKQEKNGGKDRLRSFLRRAE